MRAPSTIASCGLASLLAVSTCLSTSTFGAIPPASDATVHYRAGLGLVERGMHDLAVPELDAFLAGAPDSPDAPNARYVLAVCYAKLGRRDEALAQLAKVLSVTGFAYAPDALVLAAQCELGAGRAADAIARLDRLKREHPDRAQEPTALALRCEALVAAERVAESRDALRDAIARTPSSPARERLTYLLGRSETLLGDDAAAIKVLKPLRTQQPPGPYTAHAAMLEARSHLALGDAGAARKALLSIASPPKELADAFAYWTAVCERRDGRADAASKRLADAIAAYPSSALAPDMLVERASAEAQLGHDASAAATYDELLARFPQSSHVGRALVGKGVALSRAGESAAARSTLEQALATQPPLGDDLRRAALDELVELAAAASDWAMTERYARELVRTDDASARGAEIMLRLGVAQVRQSDRAARATLERCAALPAATDAVRVAARQQLLALARRDGRDADAQRLLGDLAEASPDALFELAVAQAAASDPGAAATFERFARDHADDPRADEARARHALALARADRRDAMLAAYAQLTPRLGALEPSLRSALRFEAAVALAAAEQADAALRPLVAIVDDADADAWHAHALVEIARRQYDAGRSAEALVAAERARTALPSAAEAERLALDERATYLVGACHVRGSQWNEAATALQDFLARFPDSTMAPAARLMCGQSLVAANRSGDAIAPLEALLATKPADKLSDELAEPALAALGQAQAALGRWTESEQAFTTHAERFPASPRSLQSRFAIGWAREQRGEHVKAIDAYRPVASAGNGDTSARAQFQIGECLFALERHEDAVRELLKVDVLFAQPEWRSAALYEAGRCLVALGRVDDANRQFDEVLRRFPESQWAAPARRERAAQASTSTP